MSEGGGAPAGTHAAEEADNGRRKATNAGPDWAWRRRLRSNPHSHRIYRTVVGVVGALVMALGLVLVPFPGPGWLIVFLGVAIWASEFAWAQRLLHWGRARLSAWNDWVTSKPVWFRFVIGFAALLLVWALFYLYFAVFGVPAYLPDFGEHWLTRLPALEPAG